VLIKAQCGTRYNTNSRLQYQNSLLEAFIGVIIANRQTTAVENVAHNQECGEEQTDVSEVRPTPLRKIKPLYCNV
jgi:hypothetical protein